jgi:hypothetical protein
MTARVRREENRAPTAAEVAAARRAGIANSQRVAGHGRGPHGKRREVPSGRQAQQAAADRQAAINQAIQLKRGRETRSSRPGTGERHVGLPDGLKAAVEGLSGMSLDGVKVHYNSPKPAQFDALAYAQARDIHLGPGQERHLPHEAWHVVQQAKGRVKPTVRLKDGVPVNDDEALEHEADAMAAAALRSTAEGQVRERH